MYVSAAMSTSDIAVNVYYAKSVWTEMKIVKRDVILCSGVAVAHAGA
jgi:hypothetical protein